MCALYSRQALVSRNSLWTSLNAFQLIKSFALPRHLPRGMIVAHGDPHPFVSKEDIDRFSTILIECGEAKLAWANGK